MAPLQLLPVSKHAKILSVSTELLQKPALIINLFAPGQEITPDSGQLKQVSGGLFF